MRSMVNGIWTERVWNPLEIDNFHQSQQIRIILWEVDHISRHLAFFLGSDICQGFRCLDVLACLLQSGGQNIVQCVLHSII